MKFSGDRARRPIEASSNASEPGTVLRPGTRSLSVKDQIERRWIKSACGRKALRYCRKYARLRSGDLELCLQALLGTLPPGRS